MMKLAIQAVLVCAILFGSASTWCNAQSLPQKVVLAKDGHALLPIVVGEKASEATKRTAKTLADYLQKISGATFTVQSGDGKNGILVAAAGDFPAFGDLFDANNELQREDYILRTVPQGVQLIGATDKGVEHAAWDMLYRLGYRRFFPNPHWEIIPHEPNLTLSVDVREHPDYFYRAIWSTGGNWYSPRWLKGEAATKYRNEIKDRWTAWERANRMGWSVDIQSRHIWNHIWSEYKTIFAEHPEYFALVNGKRQVDAAHKKFCISNPGLRQVFVRYALDYFKKNPQEDSVSIEPSDLRGWCECDQCKAIGTPSDLLAMLANQVVDAVRKKYPQKYVAFYAYNMHADPPKIHLHPGVIVMATTALTHGEVTSFDQRVIGWRDAGALVGVRDYLDVWNWSDAVPHVAMAAQVDTLPKILQGYYQQGLRSYSSESTQNWAVNGLGYYIASRVLWDVKAADHVNELVDDFIHKSFGMAAKPMKQFYGVLNGAYGTTVPPFGVDAIHRLYESLDQAWRLTNDSEVRDRLGDLVLYVHYLELYQDLQAAPADSSIRQARWEVLVRYANRLYTSQIVDSTFLVRFKFRRKGVSFDYQLPDSLLIKNTWKEYASGWDANKPFTNEQIEKILTNGLADGSRRPPDWAVAQGRPLADRSVTPTLSIKQSGNSANRVLVYRQDDGPVTITFQSVRGPMTVQSVDQESYSWSITDKDRRVIKMGDTMHRGQTVQFQAKAGVPYYFYTIASASIRFEGAAVAVQTNLDRGSLHLFRSQPVLYVYVPQEIKQWTMGLSSSAPGETAKVMIYSPDGKEQAILETGGKIRQRSAKLNGQAGFWKIQVDRAATGIPYDYFLSFDQQLAPWVSLDPSKPLLIKQSGQ